MGRVAIILFNLGGPDNLDAVKPFLRNLFSDPAIISAPLLVRKFLAWFISNRRAKYSRGIYSKIGGGSPIRLETEKQARALENALLDLGEVRAFPCMRYWHPFSDLVVKSVAEFNPDQVVLLPLYPQFSSTTTASSINDWQRATREFGFTKPEKVVCCYARDNGFVSGVTELIVPLLRSAYEVGPVRLLLSAHGLPKKIIARGDPYEWQVKETSKAIIDALRGKGFTDLDWQVCYQSRVGPLEWIGPATEESIVSAGREGKGIVLAPIAFVSEHSETLVELDIDYRQLAEKNGISHYARVPTVGTKKEFIAGLANIVRNALEFENSSAKCGLGDGSRFCSNQFGVCGHGLFG